MAMLQKLGLYKLYHVRRSYQADSCKGVGSSESAPPCLCICVAAMQRPKVRGPTLRWGAGRHEMHDAPFAALLAPCTAGTG